MQGTYHWLLEVTGGHGHQAGILKDGHIQQAPGSPREQELERCVSHTANRTWGGEGPVSAILMHHIPQHPLHGLVKTFVQSISF